MPTVSRGDLRLLSLVLNRPLRGSIGPCRKSFSGLWSAQYEEVHLKAYSNVLETQRGLEDYFRFNNGLRPYQALGYRTSAEVFHGEQGVREWEPYESRCPPGTGAEPLAEESGFSLNSTLVLSKFLGPLQLKCLVHSIWGSRSRCPLCS